MASNLLRREDWLLDAGQRADLTQLGQLHVLESLCVLCQTNVPHAALDVIYKPALSVDGDDRYALSCNVAAVLEHLATGQDVLVYLARLDLALAHFIAADGGQGVL